jgi:hypothetical protein
VGAAVWAGGDGFCQTGRSRSDGRKGGGSSKGPGPPPQADKSSARTKAGAEAKRIVMIDENSVTDWSAAMVADIWPFGPGPAKKKV